MLFQKIKDKANYSLGSAAFNLLRDNSYTS